MGFWEDIIQDEHSTRQQWDELWELAGKGPLTQEQACCTLEVLWKRSHLDILHTIPRYKDYFPTQQKNKNRLKDQKYLWWVDHATAGVNGWGTLAWFSSQPRVHTVTCDTPESAQKEAARRKGRVSVHQGKHSVTWTGLASASTHFVVFADGLPFYIIPITDGCWGEPVRNGDSLQIEMVNALVTRLQGDTWHFWAGPVPQALLASQAPVELDQPFRGVKTMMPYTWQQVISNVKLKRICIAATGQRMHRKRMSQHTDWNAKKFDMGPLWPFALCNNVAFENYPLEDYSFMDLFVHAPEADAKVDPREIETWAQLSHDMYDEDTTDVTVRTLQQNLITLYGPKALPQGGVDGTFGPETVKAVEHFQENWNRSYPQDRIKRDGIAGIQTQTRLQAALTLSGGFRKIPI